MKKNNYQDFRKKYISKLNKITDSAALEFEILVAHNFKITREKLISLTTQELDELLSNNLDLLSQSINQRLERVPLSQITKSKQFIDCDIRVNDQVLTPRSDTEMLVNLTIKTISQQFEQDSNSVTKLLDLGTGSGAIAISIADHYKNENQIRDKLEITASDISISALNLANKNAIMNTISDINFIESNLFDNIKSRFNIIITNPPYLPETTLAPNQLELKYEPKIALFAGDDGLDFYRKFFREVRKYLEVDEIKPSFVLGEFHPPQKESIKKLILPQEKERLEFFDDLANETRFFRLTINT